MADKTLKDINRRELDFNENQVLKVLPEYFASDYTKVIELLKAYYNWLDSDGNFGRKLNDLPLTRDIGQTPREFLTYIEDELLLGQNYLEGILDARTGSELSNNYYRTKGTKYSIQRFFRSFFGTDPEIIYGKDLVFTVGETIIGPNSEKFILNDKIYQYWGLLIKTDIPQSEWIDLYKLFVHPGGMYVGSQVQIVSTNEIKVFPVDDMVVDWPYIQEVDKVYVGVASVTAQPLSELSGIITRTSDNDSDIRIDLDRFKVEDFVYDSDADSSGLLGSMEYNIKHYQTVGNLVEETSPLMDQDSDATILGAMRMSNIEETMDQDLFEFYPDSA